MTAPKQLANTMPQEKYPAVYILASKRNGTLYVGVTSALWNRVAAHKDGSVRGFTQKYGVKDLVWYEHHHAMDLAIRREKQIKEWRREWRREWKLALIEGFNPDWRDLHGEINYDGTLLPKE
jgi:putative endonuclease